MARKLYLKRQEKAQENKAAMSAPTKLQLLFTIVNREKTDFYLDLIQGFQVNMQTVLAATGTAGTKTLELLGLSDTGKSVILSVIRKDKAAAILSALEEKFKTLKNGKGIAYTVPFTSTIGVAIYQFLSDSQTGGLI
jgi:hypothetical protein